MAEMPGNQPAQAPEGQGGSASDLVVSINAQMNSLSEMLSQAKGVATPQDMQKLAALQQGFQAFVESLGQKPGQDPAQAPQPGLQALPPESGGNPNARPMM